MVASARKTVFIAILLNYSFTTLMANLEESPNDVPTDVGKENDLDGLDDFADLDPQQQKQQQMKYQNNFLQMVEFFKSTQSALTSFYIAIQSLDQRIDKLEQQLLENTLAKEVEDLKSEVGNFTLQLSKLEESAVTTTTTTTAATTTTSTTSKPLTSQEYLRSLTPPEKGNSYNDLTTERIAARTPNNGALIVEIVNFLDVNLTDYQLYLPFGWESRIAPKSVVSKKREIFTFKQNRNGNWPVGVMLYRIGDTGLSLHLYFHSGGTFGAGLLDNNASLNTLWPISERNGCRHFKRIGNPTSFRCIDRNPNYWGITNTFLVHQDSMYAKLTINHKVRRSILTVEIFEFAT